MSQGIRATVEFDAPGVCPLTDLAAEAGETIRSVSTSVSPREGAASVSEFRVATNGALADDRVEHVISYGAVDVYRFGHEHEDDPCPCECLGQRGCPVDRFVADDRTLTLVFHATDFERLQELVGALQNRFESLDLKRLVRDPGEDAVPEPVVVDTAHLTDRQFEAVRTAYRRGYFERPKRANAGEVADALGVDRSTFSEHLNAGLRKVVGDVLE